MKDAANVISIISLITSIIIVPLSAYLSYHYSIKAFLNQEGEKQIIIFNSSIKNLSMVTDQFGTVLSTTITKYFNIPYEQFNTPDMQKKFSEKENKIYQEVLDFNILPDMRLAFEKLINIGFLEMIENDPIAKDKFTSLYWSIKYSRFSDIEKMKKFHIIMYNEKLLDNLKSYDKLYIENYFNNYYK
ncbi:MAG: hypothetical protein ACYDA4_04180 [Ignavibacteriaceae bacterium]